MANGVIRGLRGLQWKPRSPCGGFQKFGSFRVEDLSCAPSHDPLRQNPAPVPRILTITCFNSLLGIAISWRRLDGVELYLGQSRA